MTHAQNTRAKAVLAKTNDAPASELVSSSAPAITVFRTNAARVCSFMPSNIDTAAMAAPGCGGGCREPENNAGTNRGG